MLLLKRLATCAVLFVAFFLLLYVAGTVVGSLVLAANLSSTVPPNDFDAAYAAGMRIAEEFGKRYSGFIALGAMVLAAFFSTGLSFSRTLPWCRADSEPPPQN